MVHGVVFCDMNELFLFSFFIVFSDYLVANQQLVSNACFTNSQLAILDVTRWLYEANTVILGMIENQAVSALETGSGTHNKRQGTVTGCSVSWLLLHPVTATDIEHVYELVRLWVTPLKYQ